MELGTFKSSNLKSTVTFTDIGLLFLYVWSHFNKNVSIKITMNSTHRVWLNRSTSWFQRGGGSLLLQKWKHANSTLIFFSTSFLSPSYYRFHRKQFNIDFLTCFLYTTLFTSCTCTLGFHDLHWLRSTNWRLWYFNGKMHEKYKYTYICIDYIQDYSRAGMSNGLKSGQVFSLLYFIWASSFNSYYYVYSGRRHIMYITM